MSQVTIEVEGLKELIAKFDQLPAEIQREFMDTMNQSLTVLHENVPPYIPQVVPPEVYTRRVSAGLAGSFGVSGTGGKSGEPDIKKVERQGNFYRGEFGSNLNYAPYVVDPDRQAYMHRPGSKGRPGWWTVEEIAKRAKDKIEKLWKDAVTDIKEFLER